MTLPPLQFSNTATSKGETGAVSTGTTFDHSGFNVNYGAGVSQGGVLPAVNPLLIGAVLLAFIVWKKKSI